MSGVSLEEELRKNPELSRLDVESLREWALKQPHLPDITDAELALFLHSNYYKLEPTKRTIENYYTMRSQMSEFFTERDPDTNPGLELAMQVVMDIELGKTREGFAVFYGGLSDPDPSHYDLGLNMKILNMCNDLHQRKHGTVKGCHMIIDLRGLVFGHVTRCSPITMRNYLYYLQEADPIRLKGIHVINGNPVFDLILNIMRPFMKKELVDLLHFHQRVEDIEAKFNVPVDLLPNEAGGKAGPLSELFERQRNNFRDNKDWFARDERTRRVDESKRLPSTKSDGQQQQHFGAVGTFKKLELD